MRFIASPELRHLMTLAAHIPRSEAQGFGTCEAAATINGRKVRIVGSMVDRCTLDGWTPVLMLRSWVDGKQVSRARLFQLVGSHVGPPTMQRSDGTILRRPQDDEAYEAEDQDAP